MMNNDLFSMSTADGWDHTLQADHVKDRKPIIRKGSRLRVIADTESDPHNVTIGSTGEVREVIDGKPHDGSAPIWREDGAPCYLVAIDGQGSASRFHYFWPEEIEKD